MKTSTLSLIALLLTGTTALAIDYKVEPPHQMKEGEIGILEYHSPTELAPVTPTAHPDFIWLDPKYYATQERDANGSPHTKEYRGEYRFIPLRTGSIEVPPLPATADGTNLLLRFGRVQVKDNPLPANAARVVTLWNGNPNPPASAFAGETLDLDILVFAAQAPGKRSFIYIPDLQIANARWQYLPSMSATSNVPTPFYSFDGKNHSETTTRENDIDYLVHRYKTRFTVGANGPVEGAIAAGVNIHGMERGSFQKVSIPVNPIPPPPRGEFINSKLIGQWSFKATTEPAQPVAGQPFLLRLDIEGAGDRFQCADFDFSGNGFKSLGKSMTDREDSRFDLWRGRFEQRLMATGDTPSFPSLDIGSFDTRLGRWIKHTVLPELNISGAVTRSDRPDLTITPDTTTRASVLRPIWLNFPPILLPLIALAPMLPLIAGLFRKRLDARDPLRTTLDRQRLLLIRQLDTADADHAALLLEQEGLPLLRAHLGLPGTATPGEIAGALAHDAHGSEFSEVLRDHNARRFSGGSALLDGRKLAGLFARLSFLFLLATLLPLHAMTAEECDAAARNGEWDRAAEGYDDLIKEDGGRPALHLNLARVLASAGRLQEARAACNTVLLLEPGNRPARELQAWLLNHLNEPPVFSIWLWRPDQILVASAWLWLLAWGAQALNRLRWLPVRWPAFALMGITLCTAAAGGLRSLAYAPGQYLIISNDDPSLPAGRVVHGAPSADPAFIDAPGPDGGTRLIPAKQVRPIW